MINKQDGGTSENLYRRRDIISSWLVVANVGSQNPEILRRIKVRLGTQAGEHVIGRWMQGT